MSDGGAVIYSLLPNIMPLSNNGNGGSSRQHRHATNWPM